MQPDIVSLLGLLDELLHGFARVVEAALDRALAALHDVGNLPDGAGVVVIQQHGCTLRLRQLVYELGNDFAAFRIAERRFRCSYLRTLRRSV